MTQANRPFKYGVVGVRDLNGVEYKNYEYLVRIIERHIRANGHSFDNIKIVTGGGAGVEKLVVDWCKAKGVAYEEVRPNIKELGLPKAFIVRNSNIAARCDELIMFWDGQVRFMLDAVSTATHLERRTTVYPLQ